MLHSNLAADKCSEIPKGGKLLGFCVCTRKSMEKLPRAGIYGRIRFCCFTWCEESKKDGFGLPETAR